MDNSTINQEKSLRMAETSNSIAINGWVEGDYNNYHNLNYYSCLNVGKSFDGDNYCIIGKRKDGETVYIKSFDTWSAGHLYLMNILGFDKTNINLGEIKNG